MRENLSEAGFLCPGMKRKGVTLKAYLEDIEIRRTEK
jgi:hypothetical protein